MWDMLFQMPFRSRFNEVNVRFEVIQRGKVYRGSIRTERRPIYGIFLRNQFAREHWLVAETFWRMCCSVLLKSCSLLRAQKVLQLRYHRHQTLGEGFQMPFTSVTTVLLIYLCVIRMKMSCIRKQHMLVNVEQRSRVFEAVLYRESKEVCEIFWDIVSKFDSF